MIALLLAIPVSIWDFSASNHGFAHYGEVDQWEYGTPSGGPGGAEKLWATNIEGMYLNDTIDYLEVPIPDLSAVANPSLVFRHWYSIVPGDSAWVEVDTGSGWNRVEPVYGYPSLDGFTGNSDWVESTIDLDPFSGTTRVRFAFEANTTFVDDGWYISDVTLWDGDATPPRITPVIEPGDTQNVSGPYKVQVLVEEDSSLSEVSLTWSAGGPDTTVAMNHLGNGLYQGLIPPASPDTIVSWQVLAVDGGANAVSWPPSPDTFRVFLAAPSNLTVTYDERPIGDKVTLSWKPPLSPHPVRSYNVQDLGGRRSPIAVSGASIDLVIGQGDPQVWRVAALYDAGQGDWSSTVDVNLEVPTLTELSPSRAIQGETLHLTIRGESLYLLDGVTTLDLGSGVEVQDIDVRDVNTLEALVFVHGAAPAGLRDVEIVGAQGGATFDDAFEVLDQDLSMRIVSVTPKTIVQGETRQVVVEASEPFAGPVQVQHGDDLVLLSEPVVSGAEVTLELAVNNGATPGVHTLVLDDGARMLHAQLTVKDRVYQVSSSGCQTGAVAVPFGAGGLAILAILGLARRRTRP